jgi:hypothetical protein
MESILEEIRQERAHQDKKWGGPSHDDVHSPYDWSAFILTYLGQSISDFVKESGRVEPKLRAFRYNMIKVAALAIAAVEAVDRKLEVFVSALNR